MSRECKLSNLRKETQKRKINNPKGYNFAVFLGDVVATKSSNIFVYNKFLAENKGFSLQCKDTEKCWGGCEPRCRWVCEEMGSFSKNLFSVSLERECMNLSCVKGYQIPV